MDSFSCQSGESFMNYLSLQGNNFKSQTPEMNLINYINEVEYGLIENSNSKIKTSAIIYIKPTSFEPEEEKTEKSFLGENEMIALSLIIVAAMLLTIYFVNNNQLNQIRQYQLAQQERQDRLEQQKQQYQLAQQAQRYQFIQQNQQYQLAQQAQENQVSQQNQQYMLAQQAQQNQVVQQDQQYQLSQNDQYFQQDKFDRQYELMKQAQNASTSTTTAVRYNMDLN